MGAIYFGAFHWAQRWLDKLGIGLIPIMLNWLKDLLFLFLILDLHEGEASPVAAAGN